ncbi:MAG: hypothetical protein GPJ54_00990 [Candidatus Heimdallarchaeota archaeon]|nr:hypothetical protein [Candidatus Heimdallarchaeota archaeon]
MSENDLTKISDLDGKSVATRSCAYCKLNFQEGFMVSKLCSNCRRLFVLYQMNQMFQKMLVPSLLVALLFYVLSPATKEYAWLPPVLVIAPSFIIGVFQKRLHFRGVQDEYRIIPLFRYSKMLNDNSYYNAAVELWNLNYNLYSETHQKKVMFEFVHSILNRVKASPMNWISDMNGPTGMSEPEFVAYLFEITEIRESLSIDKGTGTLPDIWPFLDDDKLKHEVLDILSSNIETIDEATDAEKKLFLEDLFLIDEELISLADTNERWHNIIDELDNFEAETPPRNMLEEVKMNSQSQSEMQQLIND